MTLFSFLVQAVGPLTARILSSLGLSLLSTAGLVVALNAVRSHIVGNLGSIPSDGLQLAGLFGVWECLGLVLGTITFVVSWNTVGGSIWKLAKS
jgi:hypothetical protein